MNAVQAHQEVERLAKANARPEIRLIRAIEIGQAVRQGDIYLTRVRDGHPRGEPLQTRQLAVGHTNGSRHVAEAPAMVYAGTTLPNGFVARTFLGPLIVAEGRCIITHPEHAHVSLPSGVYQVTHQMDARTLQRVRD